MTQIVYDITFDEANENVTELKVTTLCAYRADGAPAISIAEALSSEEHIAFIAVYTFSNPNEVERFSIPIPAAKLLK